MHTDHRSTHLRRGKRHQSECVCVCLWCSILTVATILVCITVGLRYSGSHSGIVYVSTQGDTRLVSYSPTHCSGGEMITDYAGYNCSMYFLDEEPPLSAWNILWLHGNVVMGQSNIDYYDYFYFEGAMLGVWRFHLNKGSEITARSCVESGSGGGANFLIIKGSHNFDLWNPSSHADYEAVLAYCDSGQTHVYTYPVDKEADYYVMYYATSGAPQIYLGLTINRTEYSLKGLFGMPNCTFNSDDGCSCSAESQSSSRYVLFQTMPYDQNMTQVFTFDLEWVCYLRDGVYLMIFFLPLTILALLLFGCFGIYCLCTGGLRRHGRSSYSELREDHTHIHSQPVYETVPPPYSAEQPLFEQAPPPYGSCPT